MKWRSVRPASKFNWKTPMAIPSSYSNRARRAAVSISSCVVPRATTRRVRSMLTPDEVRAVPLFASLSDADLDRLVRTSADIRLNPGEYAVHEGGERALYAVLSGKFEVVKRFDGVER